jgi:hypothetical protein
MQPTFFLCFLQYLLTWTPGLMITFTMQAQSAEQVIGVLADQSSVVAVQKQKHWGLYLRNNGQASLEQPNPVHIEIYIDSLHQQYLRTGYYSFSKQGNTFIGRAVVTYGKARFTVEDTWRVASQTLQLSRKLNVQGNAGGGYMSSITFESPRALSRSDVNIFVPGMIYGSTAHLTETAIGGAAHSSYLRIREDRIPAPLIGVQFNDASTFSILNPRPDGASIDADAADIRVNTLISEGVKVGAIGGDFTGQQAQLGYWYPGTEGEVTYQGNTYPGGQLHRWRRRYHPVKNGSVQEYHLHFATGNESRFPDFFRRTWHWAWQVLKPEITPQNIPLIRESLIAQLNSEVKQYPAGWGISNWMNAPGGRPYDRDGKCVLGFVGKALETAEQMLWEAQLHPSAHSDSLRIKATGLMDNFIRKVPVSAHAEGFDLQTGEIIQAMFWDGEKDPRIYLRSFGDDLKALMRAYLREKQAGREHPAWLAYVRSFADWLLPQQQPGGGFPRMWYFKTGRLRDDSPQSSFNAIPFLVLLSQASGEAKYLQAAERAGELCRKNQQTGIYVGGTIDNPDVIDKEAGTLSAEAYLALYEATQKPHWLEAARRAADFAETWIFLWNVPMAADADNSRLHWKKHVPTTGAQLIATGHSLTDNYMAFDVDEYARLFRLSHDPHYKEVARLLLHNTKNMIAVPGRMYDLRGVGWSQEHFSFAPNRGYGLHRGWLPWVSTSHLNGILSLESQDKQLYDELTAREQK